MQTDNEEGEPKEVGTESCASRRPSNGREIGHRNMKPLQSLRVGIKGHGNVPLVDWGVGGERSLP
jgi:hypothetical protein